MTEQIELFGVSEQLPVNPRYLAYCRAQGQSDPNAMLEADAETWPGGKMCGFIVWIQARWREWLKAHGRKYDDVKSEDDHRSFDAWLQERVPTPGELISNPYRFDEEASDG